MSQEYKTVDKYDRKIGELSGLPDVAHVKPSTVVATTPMVGDSQTFIIQTFRQRDIGDTIFLQCVNSEGSIRLVIPPAAADAIARQRDAMTTKIRRKIGKDSAAARKARGELPGFMLKGKAKGKKKKAVAASGAGHE